MPNRSHQSRSAKGPARPQAGLCPTKAKLPPRGPAARLALIPCLRPAAREAPGTHRSLRALPLGWWLPPPSAAKATDGSSHIREI